MFIKEIRVDEGVTLKRMMPMSKGRAFRINKRTSHVTLELGERQDTKKIKKTQKTTKQKKKQRRKYKAENQQKIGKKTKKG